MLYTPPFQRPSSFLLVAPTLATPRPFLLTGDLEVDGEEEGWRKGSGAAGVGAAEGRSEVVVGSAEDVVGAASMGWTRRKGGVAASVGTAEGDGGGVDGSGRSGRKVFLYKKNHRMAQIRGDCRKFFLQSNLVYYIPKE